MNFYDYNRNQLSEILAGWGYSAYHAELVWDHLYRRGATSFTDMEGLRPDLIATLQERATLEWPEIAATQESTDGTIKYLLRLAGGQMIETVLMPYRERYTVCASTQAGCAMGCVFCATGQMGFARNLSAGEIVTQVMHARAAGAALSTRQTLRNLVLMGMGEPLHNYEATMTALEILTDDNGLALAPRHITLSTVGLAPAIRRLAREPLPVNLAVSLHGATDAERNKLVPLGRRWGLSDLMDACREYVTKRGRRIFFEWTLIAGENDTPEQAHALGTLLAGLESHVNLIPLNPTGDYDGRPSERQAARRFQAILREYNIPSTIRQRRGLDIDAGCGQLRERVSQVEQFSESP